MEDVPKAGVKAHTGLDVFSEAKPAICHDCASKRTHDAIELDRMNAAIRVMNGVRYGSAFGPAEHTSQYAAGRLQLQHEPGHGFQRHDTPDAQRHYGVSLIEAKRCRVGNGEKCVRTRLEQLRLVIGCTSEGWTRVDRPMADRDGEPALNSRNGFSTDGPAKMSRSRNDGGPSQLNGSG